MCSFFIDNSKYNGSLILGCGHYFSLILPPQSRVNAYTKGGGKYWGFHGTVNYILEFGKVSVRNLLNLQGEHAVCGTM